MITKKETNKNFKYVLKKKASKPYYKPRHVTRYAQIDLIYKGKDNGHKNAQKTLEEHKPKGDYAWEEGQGRDCEKEFSFNKVHPHSSTARARWRLAQQSRAWDALLHDLASVPSTTRLLTTIRDCSSGEANVKRHEIIDLEAQ